MVSNTEKAPATDPLEEVLQAFLKANQDLKEAYEILFECGKRLYFHGEPDWATAANECAARVQDDAEKRHQAIATIIGLQTGRLTTDVSPNLKPSSV